ncbi:ABC transporter ATP-binding protein [uncultured Aquimonas sp.]|jgi:putative ABC transport system ATP-binding protein|uniref:ABC transporter ATP-binding protein n=1 Tax=uncultured Aquimonas sp. TaxID=385483 RepID=UPI00086AA783|nr:ABC transporter ATP-binding protein [uncultured Aquimonas sp.]ODU45258.1 MAG: ABC transporter [Xanthomonadaceae bacterium SCN 69-123]
MPSEPIRQAPDPLFRLRGVGRVYGSGAGAVHALRGVDLDLHAGEVVVVLGPSGSGKSTLLNILGGLDAPSTGSVEFEGQRLDHADERALGEYRRRHVGFVFQFYNLIPSLTAAENIELVTDIADDPMPAEEALAQLGLGERGNSFPAQLSGGEQQRVAIARALAKRPRVLLCDEPTGALDLATGVRVLDALMQANERSGSLSLIVTHNADMARLGDRVVRFADGAIRSIERNAARAQPSELRW